MTLPQAFTFAIVAAMMGLFVWGRLRYDVVAMLALLASVLTGIVPAKEAFSGFSDDVVIIVATALLVSAAVARSGITEQIMRPLAPYLTSTRAQVFTLCFAVILLSTFIKNVGALAILMPVAFQLAKRSGTSPSQLLMPLAFGSLIGGLITLVGTSPNVIVARLRQEIVGKPFEMFDYAPVGLIIAAAGLICLTITYRLLPTGQRGGTTLDAAINIENYVAELRVPEGSPVVGERAKDVEALGEGEAKLTTVVRERFRRYTPTSALRLQAGDVLLIEGEPEALERIVARGGLELSGQGKDAAAAEGDADTVGVIEGVVTGDSSLLGVTPAEMSLRQRHGVHLLAISRSGERITQRLRSVRFHAGDVVVLQGRFEDLPEALTSLGILPLAERELGLGRGRRPWLPAAILVITMAVVAFKVLPIAIAFFAASLAMLMTRALSLREGYESVEWPILILLGALIPVSEAVRTTGATDLIAGWLSVAANALPPVGALALIMIAAMAVTPFLNNAATVLMMAPIAASLASKLGLNPDPFLMAVAIGAACDFLTPFGHQCNTLVMGPGGYRFGDYWKLGLPLSILVVVVGVPAVAMVWGLTPR
ncbi:SLC13 family permease [Salinarimonas soli]|uniref:SLC13 family permease n=1 Tax=Salinarimonas soli TaxID=1638099 RepID=A0A5B2VZK3_9HYPH|nr:SLC13 family permease [Salinarimonas soli]KAA2244108.1 SLC13 family permease [Salinarimonas soli]